MLRTEPGMQKAHVSVCYCIVGRFCAVLVPERGRRFVVVTGVSIPICLCSGCLNAWEELRE